MSLEQIDRNARSLARQLARFLSFEGANAARMRNNADWLRGIRLMEFLRDTGKHFTVNYMLQKESVRSRMEAGISYTEFSYMLIQAYDFWHLFRTEQCELQMGGSDQWGNITAGIELIGRREGAQAHGLVFPLITTASGRQVRQERGRQRLARSRSAPARTSSTSSGSTPTTGTWSATSSSSPSSASIRSRRRWRSTAAIPAGRTAQRLLAREVTATVHGVEAAEQAVRASEALFGGRARPERAAGHADPARWRGTEVLERSDPRGARWRAGSPAPRRTRGGASRAGASTSTARRSSGWTRCCGRTTCTGRRRSRS